MVRTFAAASKSTSTSVFCTPSDSGAPGTANPGENGCISHCGANLTNDEKSLSTFMHVGYFEACNGDRDCLKMVPGDISAKVYTHVHFAFGTIAHDFQVDLGIYATVFQSFLGIKPKRVLSFGRWSFSTSSDTYPIFCSGVGDSDRSRFAANIFKVTFPPYSEIISGGDAGVTGNGSVEQYFDEGDALVYDTNQWASYLSDESYESRVSLFQTQNFGGVTDWAIDLEKDYSSGNADDGSDSEGGVVQPCDFKLTFGSLRDLDAMASKLPLYCVAIYTARTLSAEMEAAIANYTDVNNGYDALYDYYVRYGRDLINPTIDKFLGSDKSKWTKELFDCTLNVDGHNSSTHPCPPEGSSAGSYVVYWTLKDPERFFHILEADYGIERDWVKFGVKYLPWPPCPPSQPCMGGYRAWIGYPMQADHVTIPNPKDIISKAPGGIMSLQNMVDATYCDMVMGYWIGSVADVARTIGMPVALVEQAVDSMARVKKIDQTVKDEEKKQLIIEIVTAVLVVVLFVGEMSATAAGMASLARAIAMFSEVSNSALGIYGFVEDPKSAPMAVMGMILGVAALPRTGTTFSKAGKITRGMKPGRS